MNRCTMGLEKTQKVAQSGVHGKVCVVGFGMKSVSGSLHQKSGPAQVQSVSSRSMEAKSFPTWKISLVHLTPPTAFHVAMFG